MTTNKKEVVLLLLSGGADSHAALRILLDLGHPVHCLCIDGIQGKEKIGAIEAALKLNAPLEVITLSFFDEETWNPIKLVMRDFAMGFLALKAAKKINAKFLATGVKNADLQDPDLWWLNYFLKLGSVLLKVFGIKLIFPVWEMSASNKASEKENKLTISKLKKKLFYFLISKLPRVLRHQFYRNRFARIPTSFPEGLTFELASAQNDLEAAFKLLHDSYVEQGFIKPQESGMRLIIQHCLPTTSILVAKIEGRVVGTISVMRDTPLGLPMEKMFNVTHLRSKGKRVAELSCLAIHPDFRRSMGGNIFFPLTLFAAKFSMDSFGTDSLVWNLYPHHADFYNAIFGSTYLNSDSKLSVKYLGAPASAIQLDLNAAVEFFKRKYKGLGPGKDLYSYSCLENHSYFKYPSKGIGVINYPVMTPAIFKYFFSEKTNLLQNITNLEEQVISRYYPKENYLNFIKFKNDSITKRKSSRWDIKISGECAASFSSKKILVEFLDASSTGFRAYLNGDIEIKKDFLFQIQLHTDVTIHVMAVSVWGTEAGIYGFKIINANESWYDLIDSLSGDFVKIAA